MPILFFVAQDKLIGICSSAFLFTRLYFFAAAKKYNRVNKKAEEHIPISLSWATKKRIGIAVDGLSLKSKEILVQAKRFLAENS